MDSISERFRGLRGRLIVSCQAWEDDPFYGPENMVRFARAAVEGGAAAIRANGPEDIRAIRNAVNVPIIGIQKRIASDCKILITPSFEDAYQLVAAGAEAIALDCTVRGQGYGAFDRLRRIKAELKVPVAADIATLHEGISAAEAGADFVLSTMRGYTPDTAHTREFEPAFVSELAGAVSIPVIAEGRIWTREEAKAAIAAGAFAIIVGSAVTRPRDITRRFANAIEAQKTPNNLYVPAIDLGGTNVKFGLVSPTGLIKAASVVPTNVTEGRVGLVSQLVDIGRRLIHMADEAGSHATVLGIAAAGWIDSQTGAVVYGTDNLPDWTGTPVAETLSRELSLPVFVENDANALAVAEHRFGAARHAKNAVCITLGTGVGAGCYVDGRLSRGAHSMANALGHVIIEPGGRRCTCGADGCLEQYANAAALLRNAAPHHYASVDDVIADANRGIEHAQAAIRTLATHLGRGCAQAIQLLDPELIVISGGLAQNNPMLFQRLETSLSELLPRWKQRRIAIRSSRLGYFGGVVGAAAVALDGIQNRRI